MILRMVTRLSWISNCGYKMGMFWWDGVEVNGKLKYMVWECRRYFCYKIRGNRLRVNNMFLLYYFLFNRWGSWGLESIYVLIM